MVLVAICIFYFNEKYRFVTLATETEVLNEGFSLVLSLLGAGFARLVTNYFFGFEFVRGLIMRSKNVEGYWLLITEKFNDDPGGVVLLPGIARISYDNSTGEFKVRTVRYKEDNTKSIVASKVAHIRISGNETQYLNFFFIEEENKNGFSSGNLRNTHNSWRGADFFDADISIQNESHTRRQFGERIQNSEIKKYKKEMKEEWMRVYLAEIEQGSLLPNFFEIVSDLKLILGDPQANTEEKRQAALKIRRMYSQLRPSRPE